MHSKEKKQSVLSDGDMPSDAYSDSCNDSLDSNVQTTIELPKTVQFFDFYSLLRVNARLNDKQKKTVRAVGFGSFLEMNIDKIKGSLIYHVMDSLDIGGKVLNMNGTLHVLEPKDVERVMGIKDGGTPINLTHCDIEDPYQELLLGPDKLCKLNDLEVLLGNSAADDAIFIMGYVLYVVGAILCPTSGVRVKNTYLSVRLNDIPDQCRVEVRKQLMELQNTGGVKQKFDDNPPTRGRDEAGGAVGSDNAKDYSLMLLGHLGNTQEAKESKSELLELVVEKISKFPKEEVAWKDFETTNRLKLCAFNLKEEKDEQ
uniref:Uncharacterized protein n=1 Tax=Cannabis sativa TaxID=3483 RepID=A0A803PI02_CANSA